MWREEDQKLKQTFRFPDFKTAFAFMTRVAAAAEAQDHHPWWSNVYNVVHIELYTHDAGNTITPRDHKLARKIDAIAAEFSLI